MNLDEFPETIEEARTFQKLVAKNLTLQDQFDQINLIGALDIAYNSTNAFVGGIIFDIAKNKIIAKKAIVSTPTFEYLSSFLFMREVPLYLKLLPILSKKANPDLYIIDGHGIAHPFFAGSAAVFGYLVDVPTIGIAKRPMSVFRYKDNLHKELIDDIYVKQKLVGKRVRYEKNWNPIFISPGNKISISSALQQTLRVLNPSHKLPLPLLQAHIVTHEYKKEKSKN